MQLRPRFAAAALRRRAPHGFSHHAVRSRDPRAGDHLSDPRSTRHRRVSGSSGKPAASGASAGDGLVVCRRNLRCSQGKMPRGAGWRGFSRNREGCIDRSTSVGQVPLCHLGAGGKPIAGTGTRFARHAHTMNLLSAYIVLIGILCPAYGLSAKEIGPQANLCAEINALEPGETLTLRPGEYRGPCRIRRGGSAEAPITIQAQDALARPQIVYDKQSSNVFEIEADYVSLRGLKLGPTQKGIDGIRIRAHAGVTVEDCEFTQLGGIAIAATQTSVRGLIVRRNVITESAATAMYFGCHDGVGCRISDLLVERNFIHGVDAPEPEIGYGIQIKLNSSGVIRDNVIADTKGPAIMIYGSMDAAQSSKIGRAA